LSATYSIVSAVNNCPMTDEINPVNSLAFKSLLERVSPPTTGQRTETHSNCSDVNGVIIGNVVPDNRFSSKRLRWLGLFQSVARRA